jgi:hypothetical protein
MVPDHYSASHMRCNYTRLWELLCLECSLPNRPGQGGDSNLDWSLGKHRFIMASQWHSWLENQQAAGRQLNLYSADFMLYNVEAWGWYK